MADVQGELNRLAASSGALNAKAGTSGLGFNAVCNVLVGTNGNAGPGALQRRAAP